MWPKGLFRTLKIDLTKGPPCQMTATHLIYCMKVSQRLNIKIDNFSRFESDLMSKLQLTIKKEFPHPSAVTLCVNAKQGSRFNHELIRRDNSHLVKLIRTLSIQFSSRNQKQWPQFFSSFSNLQKLKTINFWDYQNEFLTLSGQQQKTIKNRVIQDNSFQNIKAT